MIQVSQLQKTYMSGVRRKPTNALVHVSLHVECGEIFGIIGPNGAGKSTLLKSLLSLVRPNSGTIKLNGFFPSDLRCRQSLGYLPENPCLYDNLSVNDHLIFIARTANLKNPLAQQRIPEVLAMVGLDHVRHKQIRTFSKGMVQRAALACALFTQPEILILDEPMSGLDPLGRKMVTDIIRAYNDQGNTVLFCSHVLTDVERICDRIAIMDRGQLALTITPQELLDITPDVRGESPLETLFVRTVGAGGQQ
ncbi:ABC-2 type transport system ATP-binding protein [Desulfuromusa kysingii]|uniref:ABC-2 type transport system ATP-binding protein n=1 Tax=Desulfuromusa kysingii TaxID=37625 RepID=A0A1H4CX18_9BACT|nr:ABC transporter ATP-binding protein [Desulfuromusa kysingii]SEA64776.1 ABC-2 type transport system ATP-binding protein [Desulfuromusa kysingii]